MKILSTIDSGLLVLFVAGLGLIAGVVAIGAGLILKTRAVWQVGAIAAVVSVLIAGGTVVWMGIAAVGQVSAFAKWWDKPPKTLEMTGWYESATGLKLPEGARPASGRHLYDFPLDSYFIRLEGAVGMEAQFRAISGDQARDRLKFPDSWGPKLPFWSPSFTQDSWHELSYQDPQGNAFVCVLALSKSGVAHFAAMQNRN